MQSDDLDGLNRAWAVESGSRAGEQWGESEFRSILWPRATDAADDGAQEPEFFGDLNLDQVLNAIIVGREEYNLAPLFYAPLRKVDEVRYRQHVANDLEKPDVLEPVSRFAEAMQRMREHLEQAAKLHHQLARDAWFVDAVEIYCSAVRSLADDLAGRDLGSVGLRGLRDYIAGYVASEGFVGLAEETSTVKQAVANIRYKLRIAGSRVTVTAYDGEGDYSRQVLETFERFRQGSAGSHLARLREEVTLNHVEEQVLDRVARLYPDVFGQRADYCVRHAGYLDEVIARFDREVQLYVAYLELVRRLRHAGLPFCYPRVSTRSKELVARETFDVALAIKLVDEGRAVVRNDFYLEGAERMFVVTGPNNGGKTTFARTFGQLHYLASIGLPVPGVESRLYLPDQVFTHFEREEDIETLRGKLEDELVRVNEILERATSDTVIVMNESFNSTTLHDALFVGGEVMRQILELDCLGVYVTFVDELASLSDATVSMVSQIDPDDPAKRTFKVLRQPADGLAYASAIAHKYGLSYDRMMERIGA